MFGGGDAEDFAVERELVEELSSGVGHLSLGELNHGRVFLVEEDLNADDVTVDAE